MNYEVYQGDELKQTVTDKIAVINGLQPNQTYEFSVEPDNVQTVGGRTRYTHVAYANMKYVATETGTFILSERSTVRFGVDNKWAYKTFDAGTYTASIDTFGRDPYVGKVKSAEVVSDFSVGQGSNKTYIGFYSDFTEADSNDPSQYAWSPNATTSVTTRGIRFNIPKTLIVDSTITLRCEEYPLGIVPIGNEPSGYFGGGNKQNLSAKVISTANGSSIVEVAGNAIEVGGRNYLRDSDKSISGWIQDLGTIPNEVLNSLAGKTITISVDTEWSDFQLSSDKQNRLGFELCVSGSDGKSYWFGAWKGPETPSGKERVSTTYILPANVTFNISNNGLNGYVSINGTGRVSHAKIEQGDIATPYAAFVDGDTFTAQPDGTFALFSEYKALYY